MGGGQAIYYCGPAGQGSVMKGVNQLKMGLGAAIHLEILAYARHEGLDLGLIDEIYKRDAFMSFGGYPQKVRAGKAGEVGVKFRELPYYLADAGQAGADDEDVEMLGLGGGHSGMVAGDPRARHAPGMAAREDGAQGRN